MPTLYTVRTQDGGLVHFSTPAATLAALRHEGARLVDGDREALLALDVEERERVEPALEDEGEEHTPPEGPHRWYG
jgi:hypothetical protein